MSERVHRRPVDDPSRDVHVQALGFDVTALAPAEFERRGIVLTPHRVVTVGAGHGAWRPHSEFANDAPEHDHYDRSQARQACHWHLVERARLVECPTCRAPETWPCTEDRQPMGRFGPGVHHARFAAARAAGLTTLEGLRLRRTFPCLGTLRHEEWVGGVRLVQCDRCGTELGVTTGAPARAPRGARKKARPAAESEPELGLGEDDIPL